GPQAELLPDDVRREIVEPIAAGGGADHQGGGRRNAQGEDPEDRQPPTPPLPQTRAAHLVAAEFKRFTLSRGGMPRVFLTEA
ncbi:MAG: hypothetical protein RLP09_38655, partial [Sandaracinaceae bacterium]